MFKNKHTSRDGEQLEKDIKFSKFFVHIVIPMS